MKKYIQIIVVILITAVGMFFIHEILEKKANDEKVTNSEKFKKEYESLNGQTNKNNGKIYPEINVDNNNVVYKTEEITGEKRSFFGKRDKIKERRYVELYYFYAYDINAENLQEPEQVNENVLGADSLVRTKKIKGYQGKKKITGVDPHYGWTMGNFYVGGFSDILSKDGEQVILKDTGDQVSLWFDLKQNIDKCNNDDRITVVDDTEGRDDGFECQGAGAGGASPDDLGHRQRPARERGRMGLQAVCPGHAVLPLHLRKLCSLHQCG